MPAKRYGRSNDSLASLSAEIPLGRVTQMLRRGPNPGRPPIGVQTPAFCTLTAQARLHDTSSDLLH